MPLPKIVAPTYELELPSTGQEIKYRPFLVKEEKVLVIALRVKIQNKSPMRLSQSLRTASLQKESK